MCSSEPRAPIPFIENLRKDTPLTRKLELLRRNVWIKISTHRSCCGHPGEPGC